MNNKTKNKDLFQTVFEASVEGILVVRKDGHILMANPACEHIFGYGAGELLGNNIDILIPKKYKQPHEKHIKSYSENPKPRALNKHLDLWGIKKNGTEFSLDISLSPTLFEGEHVTIAFLRDATIRKSNFEKLKQTNDKLIESNRKFNTLINNVKGILFRCENNRDYAMHYISEGCLEITGYPYEDFKNRTIIYGDLILEEDRESVWEHIQTAIKQRTSYDFEHGIQHKDGSIKYVWVKGEAIYNNQNEAIALEGFVTDITVQKEQELTIKANEAKMKALISAMPDMTFIQDRKGNYTDWYANNPTKLFMPPEKFIGLNMKDVLPSHLYKKMIVSHQKAIETGEMQIVEYSYKGEKEIEHYEARVVLMSDHSLLTIIRDTTEKQKLKERIEEEEVRSKTILAALPDLISVQDEHQNIIELYAQNPMWLPKPKEQMLGKNILEIAPSMVYRKFIQAFRRVGKTKTMEVLEVEIDTLSGPMVFEARLVPLGKNRTLTIARDITNKKAQEEELLIKDRALASASNSIVISDAQKPGTPIVYCNEAFEKLTGYNKDDILGKNTRFLQNDERDQEEITIMKNAILNGQACNVVLRNYRKDGTLFWNEVTITPVHNKENKLTHFIGIQNDVTNKAKAEDLKDRTQEILELIAQYKPLKTIAEKIIETAEAHLKNCMGSILLLNNEDKSLHVLAAPKLPKSFCNCIEGTVVGPNVGSSGTASFLRKDVIVSNIETSVLWRDYKEMAKKNGLKSSWAFPIMSSTNQVLGTFSVYSAFTKQPSTNEKEMLLDLTYLASIAIENHNHTMMLEKNKKQLEKYAQELEDKVQERTQEVMATVKELVASNLHLEDQILLTKQIESEVVASQNMASAIAKNFPNGFVVVVNKDFKVLFAEGEALTQLGLKQFITNGTILKDITVFSEKRKARIKENFKKTLSGQYLSFEISYKNRYFATNTAPLFDDNNQISYALHVYNDISNQKEIEFKIQSALRKEQELNELKSRFVSMASHEFRTPLSAILTSAILIGKQNDQGNEIKREKYVAQIEKNVYNLVLILNDFLSLSKLEEGQVVPTPKRIDLVSFSKLIIKEIYPTLKAGQGIDFRSDSEVLYVDLDEKLLRLILNNLLSNASKYALESTPIDFKISQTQAKVIMEISDQGIGIPIEEQQFLFDRFFRAKNAANIEGTGLGLNIVKSYTELMNGRIRFKSKLNSGTTFWVEFPLKANK